jgi:hypothetical protein
VAEDITITAAILSALIILKDAFFQFFGSKGERQMDTLIEALIEEQRTLNTRIKERLDELRSRQ